MSASYAVIICVITSPIAIQDVSDLPDVSLTMATLDNVKTIFSKADVREYLSSFPIVHSELLEL